MTINNVEKECPLCKHNVCGIKGATIVTDKESNRISYNLYKCLKCHHTFEIKRKGDKKEQALTEKYIKSEKIVLNNP